MSWLGDVFGGGNKSKINNSYASANATIKQGNDQANSFYDTGYQNQLGATKTGYDTARGDINSGFSSAISNYGSGIDAAKTAATAGNTAAQAKLDPYVQSGYGNQKILDDYSGANGAPAQASMYDSWAQQNNPLVAARNAKVAADARAQFNAGGGAYGTRALQAATRTGQQLASSDLNSYIGNVNQNANRGASAAAQAGNYDISTGNTISGLEAQRGQGLAALDTQQAGALGNLDTGNAANIANIEGAHSGAMAGQANSLATTLAGNEINRNSAVMGAQQTGFQNLLGAAGTAISAFKPFSPTPTNFNYQPGTQSNGGWSTMSQPSPQSWWNNLNPWSK